MTPIVCFSHSTLYALERRAVPCPADELDISQSLLKALESESDSPPWPSLHINMDNKVRCHPKTLLSHSAHIKILPKYRFLPPCSPARERRSSCPKSLSILLPLQ